MFCINITFFSSLDIVNKSHNIDLGPFYTMAEKSTSRSKNLAQDMLIWGEVWYAGEDDNTINYFIKVGVL